MDANTRLLIDSFFKGTRSLNCTFRKLGIKDASEFINKREEVDE